MHSRGQVSAVLLLPSLSFPDWTCTSTAPSLHEKEGAGPRVSWSSPSSLGLTGQAKNTLGYPEQKRQRTIQTSWSRKLREIHAVSCCFTWTAVVYTREVFKEEPRRVKASRSLLVWSWKPREGSDYFVFRRIAFTLFEPFVWMRNVCELTRFIGNARLKWDNGSLFMCVTEAWADPAPQKGSFTRTVVA